MKDYIVDVNEIVKIPAIEVKVYPNPFNEKTTFVVNTENNSGFRLNLYDLTGRKLFELNQENGIILQLERCQLPLGVYICQI